MSFLHHSLGIFDYIDDGICPQGSGTGNLPHSCGCDYGGDAGAYDLYYCRFHAFLQGGYGSAGCADRPGKGKAGDGADSETAGCAYCGSQ